MNAPRSLALLAAGAALLAACDSVDAPRSADLAGPRPALTAPYTVAGTVFVDADGDGVRGPTESGIPDVLVYLFDANTFCAPNTFCLAGQVKTDAAGAYSFAAGPGTYNVFLSSDPALAGFNGQLFASYTYTGTGLPGRTVTAGPNAAGQDFGFALQAQEVIAALLDGTIVTRAEDDKFWAKQVRALSKGHAPKDVSAPVLAGYLATIEGLLLPQPFQFGNGNDALAALPILAPPTKGAVADLLQALLTAELNVVSGRGTGSPGFDQAILAYGEAVAASALAPAAAPRTTAFRASVSAAAGATIDEAISVLDAFNRSGGGSSGPR